MKGLFRRRFDVMKLILSVVICQIVGGVGAIFTSSSISTWYPNLIKPAFTPPNWMFAPVWTILYLLMGVSLFLILVKREEKGTLTPALTIFAVQLTLNGLWSYLFFGLRNPLYGFIGIILLWVMILLTMLEFSKISRLASMLLIPYLAWVTIAATLNFYLWRMNM